jgi:hypothetical protein
LLGPAGSVNLGRVIEIDATVEAGTEGAPQIGFAITSAEAPQHLVTPGPGSDPKWGYVEIGFAQPDSPAELYLIHQLCSTGFASKLILPGNGHWTLPVTSGYCDPALI